MENAKSMKTLNPKTHMHTYTPLDKDKNGKKVN